ncbi:hypothetical protein [Lacinutrix sp. Hel_I_90]|uniref:hypothetical protein n=1 Tax=Lacinutrix sp. Hel_I_90 TaxID=1249999 RepID=UPI0012E02FA6|nr:hypothetical protein [Lacinutrix sp. Hel_I_90]
MHRLTELNTPFKLSYRRVNGTIRIVPSALLRKQTPKHKDAMAPYKFNYIDQQNDQLGTAYIPLLIAVNDKQIQI